jgi:hypothetical protein
LKHGANINWENSKDKKSSPLYNAASKNYIKCVEGIYQPVNLVNNFSALLKHSPDLDYRFNGSLSWHNNSLPNQENTLLCGRHLVKGLLQRVIVTTSAMLMWLKCCAKQVCSPRYARDILNRR